MEFRVPSPARSLGPPVTPRRHRPRGSRSVDSPACSNVSGRPSTLADNLRESRGSFAFTPLTRKSILTDNTYIDEPRRKSWWKKLDDASLEVVEVLHSDNINNANDIVEEFFDIEVPSLVSKNISLDLPESSSNESIGSIIMPQRNLFTQKENVPQKFDAVVGPGELLAKPQKMTKVNMTANIRPKKLIGQGPSQRSRPEFPAGLINTTPNKTAYNSESMEVPHKKLFGQQNLATKKLFTKSLLGTSPDKNDNKEQKMAGLKKLFNKEQEPKNNPTELFNFSLIKTVPNNTTLACEIQGPAHNLFRNQPRGLKNKFADFILSESEDEIKDIQPKIFGFTKRAGSKEPQSGRGSSVSRGVRDSPMSITTDIELDDWKMLPSSTMMVDQLEDMVSGTPTKKIRLSKLSELKESDGSKASTAENRTKISNKSISSKNKSKSVQDNSKSKVDEEEMVIDEVDVPEKQNKSKTEVENYNVDIFTKDNVKDCDENIDEVNLENNATYNIKNKTHSIHKNASKLSKTNTNIEIDQQELEVPEQDQEFEPKNLEQNKIRTKSVQESNTEIVDYNDNDDEDIALIYEEDVEEPIVQETQEKQTQNDQNVEKEENINNELKNEATANVHTNAIVTKENERKQKEQSVNKTEIVQTEQLPQIKEKDTPKENVIAAYDYADDNFEDVEINAESILQDEVSEIAQDYSKAETSVDNRAPDIEEPIEQIQKEIKRSEKVKKNRDIEQNQEQIKLNDENAEENEENIVAEQIQQEIEHIEEEENKNHHDQIELEHYQEKEIAQNHEEIEQDKVEQTQEVEEDEMGQEDVEAEQSQEEDDQDDEESEQSKADIEQSQEEIEQDDEEEAEPTEAEDEQTQEVEEDEMGQEDVEAEQSQEEDEQDDKESEQSKADVEQSQEEIEQNDEEEAEPSEAEGEQTQEVEEDEMGQEDVEAEQSQKEDELDDEEDEQNESEVEESEEQIEESIEQSKEEMDQDDEEEENDPEVEGEHETDNDIVQNSNAKMPSSNTDHTQTLEKSDEIQESPNVSHDTTGRNRQKIYNELKSPEAILKANTSRNISSNISFQHQGRNTSVRKTKSMIRPLEQNPILADSIRNSIGSNGSNSSDQGSGWDSHRTTRKTLRKTFGKDFTPRKSLRALVMEKSAQRKTLDTTKGPLANSTEMNVNEGVSMPSIVDNVEDLAEETVSDHEVSRKARQTTLEMYLQKLKKDNLERNMRMEKAVRESVKAPPRDILAQFNLNLGYSGARKVSKPGAQLKKAKISAIQLGPLPMEVIKDMQYKPPKRYMPRNASWATKRLYKFLESKLEPKYDYKARVRAEKLVKTLESFSKSIRRLDVAPRESIAALAVELARLNVVQTYFDFFNFFEDFMPREMRIKVIPDIVNKLPMPRYGLYSDIIRD